jgi:hypothetical protein
MRGLPYVDEGNFYAAPASSGLHGGKNAANDLQLQ